MPSRLINIPVGNKSMLWEREWAGGERCGQMHLLSFGEFPPPSPSRRVKQDPSSLGKCQTGAGSNFFHEQSGCSRLSVFIHRESGRNEPRDGEGTCSMQRRAELQQVNGVYWCETGLTGTVALVPIRLACLWSGCSVQ